MVPVMDPAVIAVANPALVYLGCFGGLQDPDGQSHDRQISS